MSTFTDNIPITPAPVVSGTNTATESTRLPQYDGERVTMTQVYSGTRSAVFAKFNQLIGNPNIQSITTQELNGPGSIAMGVTWRSANGVEFIGNDESDIWTVYPMEIPAALATHPYFQVTFLGAVQGLMDTYIARAEIALANGTDIDDVDLGAYDAYVKRYYALRLSGVAEYPKSGVVVRRNFRTNSQQDIAEGISDVDTVKGIGELNAPSDLVAFLQAFRRIKSYATADPSSAVFEQASWEFLVKQPSITGPYGGPWDADFEWWGIDRWSAVLYPGGSWDPKMSGKNVIE